MLDKAQEIISKYQEVTAKLLLPDAYKDQEKYKALSKEEWSLKELYAIAIELQNLYSDAQSARELIDISETQEEKHYYTNEIKSIETKIALTEETLKLKTQKIDPNDQRNIILEIRAGTGGEEAALFAGDLMRMYLKYFELRNWKAEQYNISKSDTGGIKEAIFSVTGKEVYKEMKYESGVHRVQRIPSTESSGRIHTSTASVVVLPEVDDIEVQINEEDIRIDVFRSGGPGGQSVNTTDSAVRMTHIPTGIVVSCQDEKSQLKNKKRALSVLKSRIYELELAKTSSINSDLRRSAIQGGDRSAKIRTYNFPQNRITDHRIKMSWHNLTDILSGNIQDIIDSVRNNIDKVDLDETIDSSDD